MDKACPNAEYKDAHRNLWLTLKCVKLARLQVEQLKVLSMLKAIAFNFSMKTTSILSGWGLPEELCRWWCCRRRLADDDWSCRVVVDPSSEIAYISYDGRAHGSHDRRA